MEQARAPMGLDKRAHIEAMLDEPEIGARWKMIYGRDWNQDDVQALYLAFVPMQLEAIDHNSDLIPGALDVCRYLRERKIKIGTTTGYFESAARRVEKLAEEQGFHPDACAWTEPGLPGRPGPALMHTLFKKLEVESPATVLKIGDTVPDIGEGISAGAWSVVVLRGGSEIGLTAKEYDALAADHRAELLQKAGAKMLGAGAHAVIESLNDVSVLIETIERAMGRGEMSPHTIN